LATIHLGLPLLTGSCHLPAYLGGPPYWPETAIVCLFGVAPDRGYRVSPYNVCLLASMRYGDDRSGAVCTAPIADSSLWPYSSACCRKAACRTAVSRYPALWSPDLPR